MTYKFKTPDRVPAIAYQALELVNPADRDTYHDYILELGTFRPIESEAATRAVIDEYLRELTTVSKQISKEYRERADLSSPDWELHNTRHNQLLQALRKRCVLSLDDFLRFVGHEKVEREKFQSWSGGREQVRDLARQGFAELQGPRGFSKTFAGYQTYLRASHRKLYEVLSRDLPALVPEKPRTEHTYILSTTGTGKTELLKALCLNYVQQPDYAGVVILDPGGDMAPQMARWMDLIPTGQLVYIDPVLSKFNVPVINPFDAENLSERDRNLLTDQIVLAIGSLVEGKLGGSLSVNMEAILYPCVRLLVDLPNTSLLDLQALMKGDEALIEAGRNSPHPLLANYFQSEFMLPGTPITKNSIIVKLRNILGKGVLDKVLCGRTSIDLERLMAERKFIVVNLAKGRIGSTESSALGMLLVSLIQAIAMKRERLPPSERPMTHLIIDECQNFVTAGIKSIIRETRKFGLALTLAQQELGGDMPADIQKVVTNTINVKAVGRSADGETKLTGALVDVPSENIGKLKPGQFYWKNGTAPTFLLHVRGDRLKFKGGVSNDLWLQIVKQQQRYFYRSRDADDAPTRTTEADAPTPTVDRKPRYTLK